MPVSGAYPDPARLTWESASQFAKIYLGGATVERIDCLGDRFAGIYRLHFPAAHRPATAILKCDRRHRIGDPAAAPSRQFLEEYAFYRLLGDTGPLPMLPRFYGGDADGWLLIEDVGTDHGGELPFDEVGRRVAVALAAFHHAMRPHLGAYLEIRRELAIDKVDDTRPLGDAARAARLDRGRRHVRGLLEVLVPASAPQGAVLDREMDELAASPPYLATIIHDDLVNQRQCVFRRGHPVFIDFEMAKAGDALGDLARLLIGKYERNLDSRAMVIAHSGFAPAIIHDYMGALQGQPFDPGKQRAERLAVERALLRAAFEAIGWAVELFEQGLLQAGLLPDLKAIVDRTCAATTEVGGQLLLTESLGCLAQALHLSAELMRPQAPTPCD